MSTRLSNLIPIETKTYIEPFAGGLSVFFRKKIHPVEVISDTNGMVYNFYKTAQNPDLFPFLEQMVQTTPYAREVFEEARNINKNPDSFGELKKARAFWVLSAMCFSGVIGSGMKFSKEETGVITRFLNKKKDFKQWICQRLEGVYIENEDALSVIKRFDNENSLIFCDPPYLTHEEGGVDQGHYKGYTVTEYENLLKTLSHIKGNFILTNYPSDLLQKYIEKNNCYMMKQDVAMTANHKKKGQKRTEMIVANFDLNSY